MMRFAMKSFSPMYCLLVLVVLSVINCGETVQTESAPVAAKQISAESNTHITPEWLAERPFIQARGGWEPLTFVVRRGHQFSFLRNLQKRRGFADPDFKDNWLALRSDEIIEYEKKAGSTYWTTQLFKGFGLEAEAEDRQLLPELVPHLQKNGFIVGGYVGGTIAYETFLLEQPEAEDWFVPLDYWGEAATYNKQYFRRRIWFNHPGYKAYLKRAVKMGVVEYGMDLIHFDNIGNVGKIPAFSHPMAIEAFREYLRDKYTPAELKERVGFSDPRHVLPPVAPSLEGLEFFYDPLVMEWIDFRCDLMGAYIKEITDYVRSLNPNVATDINIGTLKGSNEAWESGQNRCLLLPNTDVYIVEGNNAGVYTDDERLICNVRDYKIGRTFNNLVLNRMGSPGGSGYTEATVPEQLAYNQHCLGPASMNENNWKYIQFLNKHFEHYRETENIADVAILRTYPSMAYNNYSTHQSTILFEQTLIQGNIPFDIIFDDHMKDLSKYSVLVLANQESLSDENLDLIRKFVQGGGGLVATELTSLFTDWRRRRPTFGLLDLFQVDPPPPAARGDLPDITETQEKRNQVGAGRVVYIPEIIPSIIRPHGSIMSNKYWKLPSNWKQLKDAVRWAAGGELSVEIEAPLYVVSELLEQKQQNKTLLHLVNFNVAKEPTVSNIGVDLRIPGNKSVQSVSLYLPEEDSASDIPFNTKDNRITLTVPQIAAYGMLVIQ
jgi:hypothetical protein